MAETRHWQFQLIGPLSIIDPDGRDVSPRGRKTQALLGVLALADGAPVLRTRLAEMLWSDVSERQSRESLRQALYQLKSDLGAHAATLLDREGVREALRLNTVSVRTDIGPFFDSTAVPDGHALLQACNGSLLDGLDGISIEFDQWLLAERARFEGRLRDILEGELERLKSGAAGVDERIWAAERLLRFDATSEKATEVLMNALVEKGDRAAALRAYRRCEDALRQRLDVAPSGKLRALAAAVRVSAPSPAPSPAIAGPARGRAAPSVLAPAPRADIGLTPVIGFIPLKPRLADPDHDVIGEVVAEEAIAQLSASGRMRVISRLSTSALRHERKRVDELGRLLGANFIASGSYHVAGDQVQAMIELADVRTQEVVWSERVRGAIADVLAPESPFVERICAEIAGAVADLERRRIHRLPLPTLEAFSLQLAGSTMMHQGAVSEFKRSREVLEHLVERHPDAPEPRAWLAKWHVLQVTRGYVPASRDGADSALEHTQRALDTSPDCSLAHAVEGFVHCHMERDLDAAEASFRQALAINPNESLAWLFSSVVQVFRGENDDAWASSLRAIQLSPLDPMLHYYEALGSAAALAARRVPEAIAMARRALAVNPTHLPTLRLLAVAQVEAGEIEAARQTVEKVLTLDPGLNLRDYLARAPRGGEGFRRRCAAALRAAGVPET